MNGSQVMKIMVETGNYIGRIILFLGFISLISCNRKKQLQQTQETTIPAQSFPIANAHAHNDYVQDRPLLDALENGFTSIEIDVHSYKGKAVVCHDDDELASKPTIDELYFAPLDKIIKQNGGTVYPDYNGHLILMIDLKEDKDELLKILEKVFIKYHHLVHSSLDPHEKWKPLKIVISGDPPLEKMKYDPTGYFFMDGRIHHLDQRIDDYVMPRISMSYRDNFSWRPDGDLPKEELEKMRDIIKRVHARGKKFRFWAHPETEAFWDLLRREGVDWINVDELEKFKSYSLQNSSNK